MGVGTVGVGRGTMGVERGAMHCLVLLLSMPHELRIPNKFALLHSYFLPFDTN